MYIYICNTYKYIYISIYLYIYIYHLYISISLSLHIYIYIYLLYIHIHTYIHIHIIIYATCLSGWLWAGFSACCFMLLLFHVPLTCESGLKNWWCSSRVGGVAWRRKNICTHSILIKVPCLLKPSWQMRILG